VLGLLLFIRSVVLFYTIHYYNVLLLHCFMYWRRDQTQQRRHSLDGLWYSTESSMNQTRNALRIVMWSSLDRKLQFPVQCFIRRELSKVFAIILLKIQIAVILFKYRRLLHVSRLIVITLIVSNCLSWALRMRSFSKCSFKYVIFLSCKSCERRQQFLINL